jgi:hypothetical protein
MSPDSIMQRGITWNRSRGFLSETRPGPWFNITFETLEEPLLGLSNRTALAPVRSSLQPTE